MMKSIFWRSTFDCITQKLLNFTRQHPITFYDYAFSATAAYISIGTTNPPCQIAKLWNVIGRCTYADQHKNTTQENTEAKLYLILLFFVTAKEFNKAAYSIVLDDSCHGGFWSHHICIVFYICFGSVVAALLLLQLLILWWEKLLIEL